MKMKVLALLLVIALIVGIIPTAVFAANECNHANKTELGTVDADCYYPGFTMYKCNDCNSTFQVEIPATGNHTFGNGNQCTSCGLVCDHNYVVDKTDAGDCQNYGYEWLKCTKCGNEKGAETGVYGDHDWELVSTDAAECGVPGSYNYECSVCGDTKSEPIDALEHEWTLVKTQKAECGVPGYNIYDCLLCSEQYSDPIAAIEGDHEWAIVRVEPTCDKPGSETKTCTKCGVVEAKSLDALGGAHNYEIVEELKATCTEWGHVWSACSKCGAEWDYATDEPTGHDWKDIEAVAPSCNAEGNIAYQLCANCGAAQTAGENPVPLAKFGWVLGPTGEHEMEVHEAIEATCDTDGHEAFEYCTICECFFYEDPLKLTYQDGIIPALGHDWVEYEAVEPTCDTEGNIAYMQCSVCGAAQTAGENPLPLAKFGWILGATGHEWEDIAAVEPSCGAEGNIAYQLCSVCGAAQTAGENPVPLAKFGWVLGPTGEHDLIQYPAVEATCDTEGHEAFEYCELCECFFYEDPLKLSFQDGIIPALGHDWVEYEAVEPTCDTEGNIAYMQCSVCGAAQTAGENPLPLAKFGWILGATGHDWEDIAAVEPSCSADGNIAYQQCATCGAAQTAGENPIPLGKYGWILSATGEHTLVHHEAVEVTCDTDGHYAFDFCTTCDCFFYEDPLMLTYQAGIIPATGHDWVEYEAVEPSCNAEGNIAYQQCANCGAAQTAGENPVPLAKFGWVLGPTGEHTMEVHEAVEATCTEDGHEAFEYCTTCECFFYEDPMKLTFQDGIIPAGHKWGEVIAAVEPTCNAEGNIAYQICEVCGAAQTAGENPIPLAKFGWVLGPTGEHTMEKYEAIEATCTQDGHEAFEYCTTCECFFYADPLKLTYQAGVIPALGHSWGEVIAAVEPTCNAEGNIAYQICEVCGAAQTAGENPLPLSKFGWVLGPTGEHTMEKHEAVEATCTTDGHEAFEYCTTCECFFYEDPLKLTFQAGVIPALGHNWVQHEAVDPTCFEPGNIAYEQCSVCGEARTLGENPMPLAKDRWILGVAHKIEHVEAKAATTEAEGNKEYWYCTECGYAWEDAELTKVTNLKSVIIPAIETPNTGDSTPVVLIAVVMVMAVLAMAGVVVFKKRYVTK